MRSLSGASLALTAVLAFSFVGCAKVGEIKAKKAFKSANQAYQAQDYKKAAGFYEEAVAADPNLAQAYFYLGNSYDNLYKPSKKGDPDNDALLTKAVENYQRAAEKLSASDDPANKKLGTLSLQYLVASYGPDKLNDPAKAEPVVQRMIQLEPGEPANYFALAKIYEDAGNYEQAEAALLKARDAHPKDTAVYMQMAAFYNRQGRFDKTMEALNQRASQDPHNPEGYYTIAVYYWDKTFRDKALNDATRHEYINSGMEAVNKAISIKPDYLEAIVYKGLLLRLEANMEKDRKKQADLLKEADALRDRAKALQKSKTQGAGD